jgi:desampylase
MNVRISRAVLDQILDHSDRYPDLEICGLLLGSENAIESALPADNVAADPTRTFELDPEVLLTAHKAARAGGATLLGHYHSHPSGVTTPSVADAEHAYPGALWLIVANGRAALFEAREGGPIHGIFAPRAYDIR